MGPSAKGTAAFAKNSEDAIALFKMFMSRELETTAKPNDVIHLFPSLAKKTTTQICGGFNRVRQNAKDALEALERSGIGMLFLLIFFFKLNY
jgi:hypothetical protein